MTQRMGDFIRGLRLPIAVVLLAFHFTFPQTMTVWPTALLICIISIAIDFIVSFKVVTVKTINLLEKESVNEHIGETVEGHMFEEVCKYASSKNLNPSLDFTKNGIFLNANLDNTIIGVCELSVPAPETRYLSDDYKHCYDLNLDAIDKFVAQHPEFKGE